MNSSLEANPYKVWCLSTEQVGGRGSKDIMSEFNRGQWRGLHWGWIALCCSTAKQRWQESKHQSSVLFWKTSMMTSPTFDLGHLNGDVKDALKLSIFVVQKAVAPKTGVEFCQASSGAIRSRLAMSCNAQ